uniref:Uso1/p115-like vesicle tethering protein C-terminal domain-containing protein n=1 Tax=Parascaris equorum TaxID=6256 RepID=A0A914RQJ4_PAREQ
MSSESVQVWMGCVCLMHCLFDADHLKEQLLRVQLTIDSAQAPSSLLRHIATLLVSLGNRKPQIRCALLMLLAVWLHGCPLAVAQFLQIEESVQYLTTHIAESFTLMSVARRGQKTRIRNSLNMTVERRVGNEKIVELLEGVSRSEHYFTKLFKFLEGQIIKQLRPVGDASSAQMNGGSDNVNEGIEAERELAKLKQEMAERCQIENDRKQAEQPHIEHFRSIAEQWQTEAHQEVVVQQLSAQVKQLEEQLTYGWQSFEVQGASLAQTSAQLVEANRKIHDLEVQLAAAMSNAATVEGARSSNQSELRNKGSDDEELASLKKEHEDLLVLLADQDAKISQYRQRLIQLGQTVTDEEDDGA